MTDPDSRLLPDRFCTPEQCREDCGNSTERMGGCRYPKPIRCSDCGTTRPQAVVDCPVCDVPRGHVHGRHSEWLVHPLLQAARGYLTDEDYTAVEATLQEAVERAKDLEAEVERLRVAFSDLPAASTTKEETR